MPKMVCLTCNAEYKVEKNGVVAAELANIGPYRVWSSDKWKCPVCGHEVLAGFPTGSYHSSDEGFQIRWDAAEVVFKGEYPYE